MHKAACGLVDAHLRKLRTQHPVIDALVVGADVKARDEVPGACHVVGERHCRLGAPVASHMRAPQAQVRSKRTVEASFAGGKQPKARVAEHREPMAVGMPCAHKAQPRWAGGGEGVGKVGVHARYSTTQRARTGDHTTTSGAGNRKCGVPDARRHASLIRLVVHGGWHEYLRLGPAYGYQRSDD